MNECGSSPCSQECANVYGSYQCYCRRGYQLSDVDGLTCEGERGEATSSGPPLPAPPGWPVAWVSSLWDVLDGLYPLLRVRFVKEETHSGIFFRDIKWNGGGGHGCRPDFEQGGGGGGGAEEAPPSLTLGLWPFRSPSRGLGHPPL